MASPGSALVRTFDVGSRTASINDNQSQSSGPSESARIVRDRSAEEKNRQRQERENEYWRSIVPSPSPLGLEELQADDVFSEVQRRVRREVQYLCLLPPDDFEAQVVDREPPKPKRQTEWFRCASILVVTSLNLDSPNPIGWERHEDSFVLSRLQSGDVGPSYWILGAFCRLRGAQPWQATRSYIANQVYDLLEAEGWESWITSEARWKAIGTAMQPTIEKYLRDANIAFLHGSSGLLHEYSTEIWNKFATDHLKVLSGKSAALAPLYSLNESYVKLVGAKLEMNGKLSGSLLSSNSSPSTVMISEMELCSLVMKRVKKLRFDYFPLMQDDGATLQGVCDKVLERLKAMSHIIRPEDLAKAHLVASILNDLEDQSAYLSTINQIFRVRVCMSDVIGSSDRSADASSSVLGSKSSVNADNFSVKSPSSSIIVNGKRSAALSGSSSSNTTSPSGKRSKSSKSGLGPKPVSNSIGFDALTLIELKEASCRSCILCSMPDCERCFACAENVRVQDPSEMKCCIRKLCCMVPTQIKRQPGNPLGLPEGWGFTFDDPLKMTLFSFDKLIAPAGLKIISPDGKQFHSLESAFAHIPHSNTQDAIRLLETFLNGIGSSHYKSSPNHFLVGKDYCIEFMNDRGARVTLFGKIVACMASSRKDLRDDGIFFVLQYHEPLLDVARSMGTNVPALQLITSKNAWGGCIAFERKTMCRPLPQSVILSIDQATPAETWVTPDMQSEEMVPQPDGTEMPQLTVIVRGYKIVFRAKVAHHEDTRPQYGLFVSCSSLKSVKTENDELNFRPGELVDLGVCSPLKEGDQKQLSQFIVKNYIHSLKSGRWGFLGHDDNVMYDGTDEASGNLNELASAKGLSYIRKCTKNDEFPTIHARLDPSGKVHCLFGVAYQGNWSDYEVKLRQFAPLFSGQDMEVTILHGHIQNNNKRFAETKHLQVIRMFQLEEIVPCFNFLISLLPNPAAAKTIAPKILRRALRVVHCLEIRTRELMDAALEVVPNHFSGNDAHSSFLSNTYAKLQAMKEMLEAQMDG